jgi:hypothetical protein
MNRYYLYQSFGKWTVADRTYIIIRPLIPYTTYEIAEKLCHAFNTYEPAK